MLSSFDQFRAALCKRLLEKLLEDQRQQLDESVKLDRDARKALQEIREGIFWDKAARHIERVANVLARSAAGRAHETL